MDSEKKKKEIIKKEGLRYLLPLTVYKVCLVCMSLWPQTGTDGQESGGFTMPHNSEPDCCDSEWPRKT